MKAFRVVTNISLGLTLTAAVLSILGMAVTGFYPGIIVLFLVSLVPIASAYFAKNVVGMSQDFQKNYYRTFTIVNLLTILVILWMSFVIVHDRVLQDCC